MDDDHAMTILRSNAFSVGVAAAGSEYYADLGIYESRALSGAYAPPNVSLQNLVDGLTPPLNDWGTPANDPAAGGLSSVIVAWSGGAPDPTRKRLYITGGGHNDSANNGLYLYDFTDDGAGKPVGWSLMPSTLSAIADVPLTVAAHATYDDGLPGSVHGYDGHIFDGSRNRFYRRGGSPWKLGSGTAYQGYYGVSGGSWSAQANLPGGLIPVTALDETTGKIFTSARGSFNAQFWSTDNTVSANKTFATAIPGSGYPTFVLDTTRNRVFNMGGGAQFYFAVDWAAETITQTTFTPTGETAPFSWGGFGCVFDAADDAFWIWGRSNVTGTDKSFGTVYRMDAASFAVTAHSVTGSVPLGPTQDAWQVLKRILFFDGYVCTVPTHNGPAYIMRVR